MLRKASSLVPVLLLAGLALANAQSASNSIPVSGEAPRPVADVFRQLKRYFSDPTMSMFKITGAYLGKDEATLTASMDGVSSETWDEWAYCKVDPVNLLDTLDDGTARVKVKLEATRKGSTFVTVEASFAGDYSLGTSSTTVQSTTVQCTSKSALEGTILAVAGVPPPTPTN